MHFKLLLQCSNQSLRVEFHWVELSEVVLIYVKLSWVEFSWVALICVELVEIVSVLMTYVSKQKPTKALTV